MTAMTTKCEECERLGWPTRQPLYGVGGKSLCFAHANPGKIPDPLPPMFEKIQALQALANSLAEKLNELKGENLPLLDTLDLSCARSAAMQIQRHLGRVESRAVEKLADEISEGRLDRVARLTA